MKSGAPSISCYVARKKMYHQAREMAALPLAAALHETRDSRDPATTAHLRENQKILEKKACGTNTFHFCMRKHPPPGMA